MNVFFEFYKIVGQLQQEEISYALIGGVAMAFYSSARFTEDIDILISADDLGKVREILGRVGYVERAVPWTFQETEIELHRFLKVDGEDHMVLDVMASRDDTVTTIIDRANRAESDQCGLVRVANKEDLVWLKRLRNSEQDQLDIKRLLNETD